MNYSTNINPFHILVVAPTLYYLSTTKNQNVLQVLPYVALVGILYHSYRLYNRVMAGVPLLSYWNLINLFHIFIVFPAIYALSNGNLNIANKTLQLVAVGIVLYHGYRVLQNYM